MQCEAFSHLLVTWPAWISFTSILRLDVHWIKVQLCIGKITSLTLLLCDASCVATGIIFTSVWSDTRDISMLLIPTPGYASCVETDHTCPDLWIWYHGSLHRGLGRDWRREHFLRQHTSALLSLWLYYWPSNMQSITRPHARFHIDM